MKRESGENPELYPQLLIGNIGSICHCLSSKRGGKNEQIYPVSQETCLNSNKRDSGIRIRFKGLQPNLPRRISVPYYLLIPSSTTKILLLDNYEETNSQNLRAGEHRVERNTLLSHIQRAV